MSQRRTFITAMAGALLVFFAVHFMDFQGSVPRFKEVSQGGALLDVSPSFSVDEIYRRISDYGEAGRRSYSFRNVTVDVLLPLSLLPFLLLLMLKAVNPLKLSRSSQALLLSFPVVYVVFDLAENTVVLILLAHFPERMDKLAAILPYVTSVKRLGSLLAIFVPLGILGVRFLGSKLRRQRA